MKKNYMQPQAEKCEFDYTNTVTASSQGHKYRLYTDGYYGCRTTETNKWVNGDMDSTCTWD